MSDKIKWLRENAMFSCQNERCATEMSFPAEMLRSFRLKPICEECFEFGDDYHELGFDQLPNFDPFAGLEES